MEPLREVPTCPESQVELGHFVLLIGRDLTLALRAAVVREETLVQEEALGWLDLEWPRHQGISQGRQGF